MKMRKWQRNFHLKAVSMMPRATAWGHEAVEVLLGPSHAPPTHSALSMRSSHAPLAPAVSPARGHEDVVTVDNLLAHTAPEVELGPAVRLPASCAKYKVINQLIARHFENIKSKLLWIMDQYLQQLQAYCRTRRLWFHTF